MNLFKTGAFTLSSGATSRFKIDCDALAYEDVRTIALQLALRVQPFGKVHGIPEGGKRLALAMHEHRTVGCADVLIVDDVWTTGQSMTKAYQRLAGSMAMQPGYQGAVIFARTKVPWWVIPMFEMWPPPIEETVIANASLYEPTPTTVADTGVAKVETIPNPYTKAADDPWNVVTVHRAGPLPSDPPMAEWPENLPAWEAKNRFNQEKAGAALSHLRYCDLRLWFEYWVMERPQHVPIGAYDWGDLPACTCNQEREKMGRTQL